MSDTIWIMSTCSWLGGLFVGEGLRSRACPFLSSGISASHTLFRLFSIVGFGSVSSTLPASFNSPLIDSKSLGRGYEDYSFIVFLGFKEGVELKIEEWPMPESPLGMRRWRWCQTTTCPSIPTLMYCIRYNNKMFAISQNNMHRSSSFEELAAQMSYRHSIVYNMY